MQYTRKIIDEFLPAVWDKSRITESHSTSPEADMPRARNVDPTLSSDPWAVVADLERALRALSTEEAQALFLHVALDLPIVTTAHYMRRAIDTVRKRVESGYENMLAFLNGYE